MPLVPFSATTISLPVADRKLNDTVIKQKATFLNLQHAQGATTSSATITVKVNLYADNAGAYGDELTGPGFQAYQLTLVADNNTIVNAQTGAILAIRQGESDALWQVTAELQQDAVMFQGDFFLLLRDTQPIKIGDMIRQHIQQADKMGRFA